MVGAGAKKVTAPETNGTGVGDSGETPINFARRAHDGTIVGPRPPAIAPLGGGDKGKQRQPGGMTPRLADLAIGPGQGVERPCTDPARRRRGHGFSPAACAAGFTRTGERPAVTLGPAAFAAPAGATPGGQALACRRPLDAASRHALGAGSCAGFILRRGGRWPRGLGLRPRRASDRLPPSFGPGRDSRVARAGKALQPGPREAAPPLAPPKGRWSGETIGRRPATACWSA
jgi:hypothetical protein